MEGENRIKGKAEKEGGPSDKGPGLKIENIRGTKKR